jgi:hypothetical protein
MVSAILAYMRTNLSQPRWWFDWLFLGVTRGLPLWDKKNFINALENLGGADGRRYVFAHLYENLTILDNKANSMIQFVALLFTIYLGVGFFSLSGGLKIIADSAILRVLVGIGVTLSFVATLLFMWVERLHWSTTAELSGSADVHALRLLGLRNRRTIYYRTGWRFAALSLASLLLILIYAYSM